MPVSSLPSPFGIGSFGKTAQNWVDFLQKAGQTYWQVLPLSPTGFGDSPYQSCSAFAGNPYFIDLDLLCENGLLKRNEYENINWGKNAEKVNYGALFNHREKVLRLAHSRFKSQKKLDAFCEKHKFWINDYALYMAIKAKNGLAGWETWEDGVRLRKPEALEKAKKQLAGDINYHIFVQYLFYTQWEALKAYANKKGISIIGDIPFYVSMDSADAWANSGLFYLDEDKKPIAVAGCPPDAFSADGQLWGNPLYRWDVMAKDGYSWWLSRLRACFGMYDIVRIDHFRGFESYYTIPYGDKDTHGGKWQKGPDKDFIGAVNAEFGQDKIIAEDLGYLTDEVRDLLSFSGFPGIKVLQFAFDTRESGNFYPHGYTQNSVLYTGTHDNDTVLGWFKTAAPKDTAVAAEYLGIKARGKANTDFIRACYASVANTIIIPMAEYLALGSRARLNTPSTLGGGNWAWRMRQDALTPQLANDIARMAVLYERVCD